MSMNAVTMNQLTPTTGKPWWKEPYVWLVVGGPLVVVVAAIATAVIAFEHPDPVIDRNGYQQAVMSKGQNNTADLVDDLAKLQPAHQARNHAASPVVPVARD
jgi:hypothetical protein